MSNELLLVQRFWRPLKFDINFDINFFGSHEHNGNDKFPLCSKSLDLRCF